MKVKPSMMILPQINVHKMSDKLKKILDFIKGSQTVLITSHRDPDGDSVGSQLALARLVERWGKGCRVINQGELPNKYVFLDPYGKIENADTVMKSPEDAKAAPDLVLVLDCTSIGRVGEVEKLIPSEATLVNIDHHPDNENFGTFNYVDVNASAAGEIIFNLLRISDFAITSTMANQLYVAILSDTGRFKFSNTSPGCLKVCAELLAAGANPKYVTNHIYFNHSLPFLRLLGSILNSPQILDKGRICIMTLKQDLLAHLKIDPKEVEGVVDYSLFLKGVEIGLLFTEKGNEKTKVNLRSQNEFDVSKVARAFGGGGHRNAAGCTVNHNLGKAKAIILEQIQKTLKDEPVRSLSS
jgi:phosphoesterase RecJ-like protein